ncbi:MULTISPECIES: MFS transporter [unclassified Caulobacter]|uniref:spinster family MFS transporter n=2 Tax=unclassified Caulobacter TaxID=2648921 RepID=UPI0004A716D8|nr:MFS transporter [Caulobacter sp. UNC358MFTsu5.1]
MMSNAEAVPVATAPPLVEGGTAEARAPDARAWVALGCLWFIYVLNFLDRQLLSILAKPIQDTLHITDSQLGLLGGLYFAAFYCFIAIPVGWLADRTNRVAVLAIACGIWSAATMACGVAKTYGGFAVARMTVGFGEAGGVPPSYAIITDYFPPGRRGRALGLYNLGPPVGAALGIAFGASVAAAFSWRDAFLVTGGVGLVAALALTFIVREPKRGGLDRAADAPAPPKAGFGETLRMFVCHPALMLAALGGGATQFITYGLGNFATLFLMREKGMTLQEVALWYALVVGVGMSVGIFGSGWLIDRFTRVSKRAYGLAPAIGLILAVPFFLAFVWAPSWPLAIGLLIFPMCLNHFYLSPAVALVQTEVRPNQRVMSGALLLLVMNFIGLGLGPTYVGAASDFFRADHPTNSLQMALFTLAPFYALAIGLFLALARLLGKAPKTGAVQ